MIDINRNNYEEYFLDFMEGNLKPSTENLLMLFLERNPDLKEELDLFAHEVIPAESIQFENKATLRKSGILSEITNSNFDDLCVARLEGDLEESAIEEFDNLIEDNPDKQKEYKLYTFTKIYPQENIVYPHKSKLKKSKGLAVGLRKLYIPLSVAASVILLLTIYLLIPKQNYIDENLPIAELKNEAKDNKKVMEENAIVKGKEVRKIETINISITNNKNGLTKQIHKINNQVNNQEQEIELKESHQLAYLNSTEIKLTSQTENNKYNNLYIITTKVKKEENDNKDENYMTVKTFLAATFNQRVLKKDNKKKIELFDLAQAGIKAINRLTGSKMTLERKYNQDGKPTEAEFNSRLLAFSAPIKKE